VITVAEALAVIARNSPSKSVERVPLSEGLGRTLAGDIRSDVDWPPFDTSAMDGYAVRLSDLGQPGAWLPERPGAVVAGDVPPEPIAPGEAVRVMTGAPLPDGTEAVIPVEQARREVGRVRLDAMPAAGADFRSRAESIPSGSLLVPAGGRLTPGDLALAALAGADPLSVVARPRVAVVPTGNELVPARDRPRPGQIRDSNGPMLLAFCRARGFPARELDRVADEASGLASLFAAAGTEEDVLVTSGGVSAGDLDLLPGIARAEGFEILFHGVSVRPGKPIAFGRRGETLWFGLPGNPVSSSVCFHLFVRFALDCLEGSSNPGAPRICAQTTNALPEGGPRETYRDGKLSRAGPLLRVEPLPSAGSHDIATHARADALIRVPARAEPQPAGTPVECLLL